MAAAATQSIDQRADLFARLATRNRFIAVLRILVPAMGAAILLSLIAQILLAGLVRQYGVAGIRVDRGNLVVETPQYSAMNADGARYLLTAAEARTPLGSPDSITMVDATLELTRPGREPLFAAAGEARMHTAAQTVDIPGIARVHSNDGMHGTLSRIHSDLRADVTTASGPVDLTLSDGTTIHAANMQYDGARWIFGRATVVVPGLPGAGAK